MHEQVSESTKECSAAQAVTSKIGVLYDETGYSLGIPMTAFKSNHIYKYKKKD